MAVKFTKVLKGISYFLPLVPALLWAFEFSMPNDVTEQELGRVLQEKAEYGDSKRQRETEEASPPVKEPEGASQIATTKPADAEEPVEDDAGVMNFPLLEAETEPEQKELAEGQGSVIGQVFDKESGAPVRGVAIAVEGTDFGTITDEAGNFKLNAIPEGSYTLAYFKTGYLEANITDVAIELGETKTLNFALPPRPAEMSGDVYDLGTVTVTADEVTGQNSLLLEMRQQAVASVDAISAEDFSRFAASDAADVLKNVTGVSISDGKFAVVRGLDDRFSTVSLNGIVVPSPDPDRLAVPLDIFPSGLLESVVTQKSYTPDQPGESSGGSINLKTKSFPEEFTFKFSTGIGYNENATREDDFLLAGKGNFEPSPIRFAPKNKTPGLNTSFSGEIGNTIKWKNIDIGVTGGFSYKKNYSHAEVKRNRIIDDGNNAVVTTSRDQTLSNFEEQLSSLIGANLRFTKDTSLSYTALYSSKNEAEGFFSTIETDSSDPIFETSANTVERQYWNHQAIFDHKFDRFLDLKDLKMKFSYAYSENSQDEPDTRFSDSLIEGDQPNTFDSTDFGRPVRYNRSLDQDDNIFKMDFEVPADFKQLEEVKFKFGYSNEDTVRIVSQREFLGPRSGFDDSSFDDFGTSNPDSVIDLGIPGLPPIIIPGEPHFTDIPGTTTIDTGVAEGKREIQSIYLQSIISPVKKFEFTLGARIEDNYIEAVSLEPGKLTRFVFEPVVESRPIDEKSVLPALTASFDLTDKLKFRLGVSETVAKPSFRELNPNPTFNPTTGDAEIGNPGRVFQNIGTADTVLPDEFSGLKLVDVTNFDVRAEWFYTDEDFISLSFFKKKVDGPIERISVITGGGSSFTFFNNDNVADVFGTELEARMYLSHLSELLSDFYIGGNYTYIDATVERSSLEASILPNLASKERALYNQPEDIINAFVGYKNESIGLDITLSANQVGRQLYAVIPAADIFTDSYVTLNLVIGWRIIDNISIKFAARNLLNPLKERSFDTFGVINDIDNIGDDNGVAGSDTDFSIRDSYRSGRTYSVSANIEF